MKKYFCEQINDDRCFTLKTIKELAQLEGLAEVTVQLAKRKTGIDQFFCFIHESVGEKSDSDCGKSCKEYQPRNGKSGRCVHSGWCYEPVGESITIKIKQP